MPANHPPSGGPKMNKTAPRAKKRTFLSTLQAVYKATKLYIALLVAFAGIPAVVAKLTIAWGLPWPIGLIASIIPAALISLWMVPVWLEQHHKNAAAKWGIAGVLKYPEYFRLTSYELGATFHRADNFHEAVYRWLRDNPAPLLYLCGVSGSGKSSILAAWVLPKLAEEHVPLCVISVRIVDDPISAIITALTVPGLIWKQPPTNEVHTLDELMMKAARQVAPKKLLLILDQFEEFLILTEEAQRGAFTRLLRALAERPINNVQVLMVLRSDYRPLLATLRLPECQNGTKEVPPFFERDAMAFLRASGLKINKDRENEIRDEAREVEQTPGLIRPITVNLFGLVLRSFEVLPKEFRRGTLLRSYLRSLLLEPNLRTVAPRILRCMITSNGTKYPITESEIANSTSLNDNQVRGYLLQLASKGIVRELNNMQGTWEVAHDFIASLYDRILVGMHVSTWNRVRPWVISCGLILWFGSILTLPALFRGWQDSHDRLVLGEGGFINTPCLLDHQYDGRCFAWERFASDAARLDKYSSLDSSLNLSLYAPSFERLRVRELELKDAPVDKIEALSGLTYLEVLDLTNTKVTSISTLKNMPNLRVLRLRRTPLSKIGIMTGLKHLEMLDLGFTEIQDIQGLSTLTSLRTLDLEKTKITKIEALESLKNLENLNLAECHIKEISALNGMNHLERLSLADSNVSDLTPLRKLKNLSQLQLIGTPVKDVNALSQLPSLKLLYLGRKYFDDSSITALKGQFPATEIIREGDNGAPIKHLSVK
ncbi:Leucine Rich repeat-containing protein [Paraburkholderia steynii]|uniref:Leucine Rich repeat-containing protein n=1 Tax=Paraburkholderia steynii TaxID=1245441 RepID=A0A7Z7B9I8_9BURK|nr:leucine-rich repeat domain-containing protein [Paraburkholderia steynii]SDH78343.1 Leucine Rich repeat-containing protein [Paraburkholderia steynii]